MLQELKTSYIFIYCFMFVCTVCIYIYIYIYMGHSTETSTILSLDFTEILQLKYTLGLQFFFILKWNNVLFGQLHLPEPSMLYIYF